MTLNRLALTKLDPRANLPARATAGSLGFDLALLEETTWDVGEVKIAPCGIRLADGIPSTTWGESVAMLILPRSSLFLKHGLIIPNSPGLVDADYTGPIGVVLWRPENLLRDPNGAQYPAQESQLRILRLPAGTRVAQALFVPVYTPELYEAEAADRTTRSGFGSTG